MAPDTARAAATANPAAFGAEPGIVASWRRSKASRVDPLRAPRAPRLNEQDIAERLAAGRFLIDAALPHLEWLSTHFASLRHVVYLTDGDGIVLASLGDAEWQQSFGLLPGHDWSEATMGTNGAGTALLDGVPVAVVGPQHYVEAFADCTCVAAPIRDASGQTIGAIDLSIVAAEHRPERGGLVSYVALMIERDLHLNARVVAADSVAIKNDETDFGQALQRLQLILEHAPVLIYLVDVNGRFLNANRAWHAVTGLRPADVIGRTLRQVFDAETAAQFEANNRSALNSMAAQTFEEINEGRTFLSVKVPVRDAAGHAYAVCGMSVDITERAHAEALLRESEERFRVMADHLPLIVWLHGPDGEQQFVNETFCRFFGVSRDEMVGGRWQALMHPDDGDAYALAFADCVRTRAPFHGEVRVRAADGAWRWLESWAQPRFGADGTFLGFVGTSADITDRRSSEAQLRAVEAQLRETDKKKNEFIATLAHELRNPLDAICNAAHLAQLSHEKLDYAMQIVSRQVQHLVRLVDDLMDISRLTLGKISFVAHRIDLRVVVENAVAACESQFVRGGQRFERVGLSRPAIVCGDSVRLCQALTNLLGNAARYTPAGGHVRLLLETNEHEAIVVVEDSGIGLSNEDLAMIFEPFTQGQRAEAGGLGVGLALVRRIVELHRGTVDASSAGRGQGSRFVVRLPLASAAVSDSG